LIQSDTFRGGDPPCLFQQRFLQTQSDVTSSHGCTPDSYATIDGPFAETKEVIGGCAILQANSKQEAIELVREFLGIAGDGECEIRQLYEAAQSASNS
jgi:hypothetical protein